MIIFHTDNIYRYWLKIFHKIYHLKMKNQIRGNNLFYMANKNAYHIVC